MKYKIFFVISIVSFILLCGQDFADSQKISIHELQAKSYADSSVKESPAQKTPGRTSYMPIAVGAVFIVLYAAVKKKRKK